MHDTRDTVTPTPVFWGVLSRLRRDRSGNTLAMVAMATIPLVGMVGSAVDIGRSYLIKSRLQQACDAGVLATRRSMGGSDVDDASIAQGQRFFTTNFAADTAGATNVTFTPSGTADGQVTATASARVPMSISKVFGTDYIDMSVTCDARLEVSNTDVMMVLDTTGSMADCPDDSTCNSNSSSKIAGLRQAVLDFYDTVNAATSADARFRIGFVPYSSAVNVGIDPFTNTNILNSNWMVDTWTYQSRVANMTTPGWHPTTTYGSWTNQTYPSAISNSNCTAYGNNTPFSGFNPSPSGNPATPSTSDVYQNSQPSTINSITYQRSPAVPTYSGNKTCIRQYRTVTTVYALNGRYGFTNWDYKPVSYDVSSYRAGNVVNAYVGSGTPSGSVAASGSYNMVDLVNSAGSTVPSGSTTYDGCVEERDTVAQTSYAPIPSGAYDLDINTTPSSTATKWRPMWQELIYDRTANNGYDSEYATTTNRSYTASSWCPVASSKLAVRSHNDVQTYVNTLIANGNTFHDLGMAWGARMLSPTGMWASENATAPNGKAISRHLLFLTDGTINTPPNMYSAHGYEESDRRVIGAGTVPTTALLNARHAARFQALCDSARANNITVWTIAFGTSNPSNLVACADSGKAYSATNSAALRAQFQSIASQIAALRLSR